MACGKDHEERSGAEGIGANVCDECSSNECLADECCIATNET